MKLDRKSVIYRSVSNLWKIGAIMIFSGASSIQSFNFIAAAIIGGLLLISIILSTLWEYLVWKNYNFFIENDGIRIKHGVLRKNQREIPLSRIQNVDVKKNLFHRILGIAQVKLETAGGKTTEASLRYVDENQTGEIRDRIRELKRGESEDREADAPEEPLYEITDRELGILGVTSVSGRIVLLLFAALGIIGGTIGSALDSTELAVTTVILVLLLTGIIVTWAGSALLTMLKYYDFRLYVDEDSLEYERGLLNRSEGSIPLSKIQKLTVEENPLKRLAGYSTLKIETAGYSAEQGVQQGPEAAVPLARRGRTVELAREIEEFQNLDLGSIPRRARRRYFGRYMIVNVIITGGATVYAILGGGGYLLTAGIFTGLTALSGMAAQLKWKNTGYALDRHHLFTMRGFWNRRTMITPYYRIQNLIESQTVLQRRWNLATLILDVAGTGTFQKDAKAIDLGQEDLKETSQEVYSRFKDSLNG